MTPRGVGNERGQQFENKLKMDMDHLSQNLGGDGDNSAFLLATGRSSSQFNAVSKSSK